MKKIITVLLLFSTIVNAQVAKDTIYNDQNNYITSKESATTYTLYDQKQKQLQSIETFLLNTGTKVAAGKAIVSENQKIKYNGDVNYYTPEGKLQAIYTYDEDGKEVSVISYNPITGQEYFAEFNKDNRSQIKDGEILQLINNVYYYIKSSNYINQTFHFINPQNFKNRIVYTYNEEGAIIHAKHYDSKGSEIETLTYKINIPWEGSISYLSTDSFRVKEKTTYKEGKVVESFFYYTNGNIQSKTISIDDTAKETTYYNQTGKEIGSNTSTLKNEYEQRFHGTVITFEFQNPDIIYSINEYENNVLVKASTYYSSPNANTVEKVSIYNKDDSTLLEEIFYDKKGKEKGRLTYDDYVPIDGTLFSDNKITVYKDGNIVSITTFYNGTNQIFEKKESNLSIYYDLKGNEIGRMTYEKSQEYGHLIEYDGSSFLLESNKIVSQIKYKKGLKVYMANYNKEQGTKPYQLLEETFYKNNIINKIIKYYNNGQKQEEQIVGPSYYYNLKLLSSTFYDSTGKVLSQFNHELQDGIHYEFYTDNHIKTITEYDMGTIVSLKSYMPNLPTIQINDDWSENKKKEYYLAQDIDYNKEGRFYNQKGKLVSTATYKDGKPYTGKIYIYDNYTITITNYENGQKEGVETISANYSLEDLEFPYTVNYFENGELTTVESFDRGVITSHAQYKDGLPHGNYIEYNSDGSETYKIIYQNGDPYNGVLKTNAWDYNTSTTYHNGRKTKKEYYPYDDNQKKLLGEELYADSSHFERKIYDLNGNLLYQYNVANGYLHGLYKAYENGKIKHQGIFDKGYLVEGNVAVKLTKTEEESYYSTIEIAPTDYTILELKKNTLKVNIYTINDNKIIYSAETKIKQANTELDPILSKKIKPVDLYPKHNLNANSYSY